MYTVSEGISGKCIRATLLIEAGSKVLTFDAGCVQKEKTYQTIQVGPDKHYFANLYLSLLNHSCDPNLIVNTEEGIIYAQKAIHPGEELNYFYPSTEWDMARPFLCNCGNSQCIRIIRGARWTPLNILLSYYLNSHIVELIKESLFQANSLQNFLRLK